MPDGIAAFTVDAVAIDQDDDGLPQREKIIGGVIAAGARLWRDEDGEAFVTIPKVITEPDGALMHMAIRSRRFALIARRLYGIANPVTGPTGTRPGSVSDSAMSEAIPAFEAIALASDNVMNPGVRLLRNAAAIWLDLGDESHCAVRITAEGWAIEARAEAPLVRRNGMRSLPAPARDGQALRKLRNLINIQSDTDFRLVVAWLVAALHDSGPYTILAIDGEQGSGKSTTCRMLRQLIDPNVADLRAMPRTEDDLLIAASNSRIIAIDNVSYIDPDTADALCRVATGAGFGKRTLYSNNEETIFSVSRPILLNGIPSLLARGDLADRAITVTLPHIPDERRRPEQEVWTAFDAAAPGILALLLDALVTALRNMPTLKLQRLPRMADFARLACAAAPAFGWTAAEMLTALEANKEASIATIVEADPLAEAVLALVADQHGAPWAGTASMLLEAVNMRVAIDVKNERTWPRDAARLAARLRRVAPALRRAGVEVENTREGHDRTRRTVLRQIARKTPSAPSAASAIGPKTDADGAADGNADGNSQPIVRTNSLKRHAADGADGADGKIRGNSRRRHHADGDGPFADGKSAFADGKPGVADGDADEVIL